MAGHRIIIIGSGGSARALSIAAHLEANVANFRIIGRISEWSDNNARDLGKKVDDMIAQGAKEAFVYINSEGGNVLQANEIVNILKRFPNGFKGEGGALVASAGTYIALHCKPFNMASNGQYMIHKPEMFLEGNEDKVESSLKLLKGTTQEYRRRYADKTGLSEDDIEALWAKGDVWMTAQEAVSKGFIDGITGEEAITGEIVEALRACGAPTIPTVSAQHFPTNTTEMKIDPIKIGLPKDATEEQINARLDELQRKAQKADQLEQEATRKAQEELDAKVKKELDEAIKAKKITAEVYADWQADFKSNFDAAKRKLDAIAPLLPISKQLDGSGTPPEAADRSKWTYQDYLDKDPGALGKMREEDETRFNQLMEAHYNEK